ncbi:polysaccharide deacetylase family protein [Halopelagius longus]|uniref:Peptidoglycan/xylan/chitin deacetylase, PgdA/CDA1 family n=1 Tax=Halopelagius longus TaxID=1236180 RepID=A0A1H1GMI7_9EURY|nr:polysaccharide deacetylase family protein [Halopelagius longus]RDI69655.1 polysaccharide deacetylase [Halopelagius longus]SDR14357.1 Peptidoglycan/xylan/chitin deacetylase, PgdA/CDA1 family [Halopelagius longus]
MDEDTPLSRRSMLGTGAVALATLSGCLGGGDESTPTPIVERPAGQEIGGTTDETCERPETRDSDDRLVVEFDSREALRCQGRLLDGFEELSQWKTYEGSVGGDLSTVASGTQSARLTSKDGSRAWMYRRFEDGIDLSDRDVSLAVHPGQGDTRVAQFRLQLLAPDRENRVEMWHGVDGVAGWVRLDSGPTEFVGDPDLGDVREVRIQSLAGEADAVSCNVDGLRTTPKLSDPGVVVTFDGVHTTQYQHAFPIMRKYGFSGAVGVTPRLLGTFKHLDESRLREMQDEGWDVVSNPRREKPLPNYSPEKQEEALRNVKRWLLDNGFEEGARFVHWPGGRADAATLDLGAKYHYMGFLDGQSPTGRVTGPMTVGRVNGDDVERTLQALERAERSGQVVVVEYHTVGATNDNRATVEEFSRTMRRIDELGLRVLTPSELWEMQSTGM